MAYSKDNPKVVREVSRVAKVGAYVAVGCEYHPKSTKELKEYSRSWGEPKLERTRYWHTDDILKFFVGRVNTLILCDNQHSTLRNQVGNLKVIFTLKK